ncbi:unnamed protein product [Rotaria sordida]|uniref:histone acetyltransferase n=1 Tax=Rotaria sordida TaxID=392033 RepID=A0A818SWC8_9BILA|nr:unnamed protein product [Rotaria sordida]CAF3678628.1 unnamed protein product [Rotaria sordida]
MNNNNNNTPLSNRSDGTDSGSIISSIYSSNSVSSTTTSNNSLINRSFPQQTPITMNSDIDSSVINNTHIQQIDQRRQIIHHLALLLHAHKCLQRERQIVNNGDIHDTTHQNLCTVPHCTTMRTVLQHMTKCSDFKNCSFNNCVQSRHIILHWKNCTTPNCFLCGSLKKPSTLRSQNPSTKEWQQNINQDHRSHLVRKITSALLNTIQQDNHPLSPDRLALITNYAQKTEADTYNTATSHEDYFQRLAERIYKIQKDYEEKQILKKQQALTTTLTSIDKSAGEQGPPNRIAPQIDYSTSFSTTQIKSESDNNYHTNSTTTTTTATLSGPFDQHRISTDGISRLAIHSNNSNTHADTNESHIDTTRIKVEEIPSNHDTKIQSTTIVKKEEKFTTETSINGNSITKITVEMISSEKTDIESTKSNRPPPIDATSKSLPKHSAVFSSEDIREKMTPLLRHMYDQEEGIWFRQPVTEAIAPGYFDIIKYPMDFSTIFKKLNENQYATPFQFCEDIWLVFNNAWTFNKKSHRVYKAGVKLADIFMDNVDPIMKDYGYCCGRQYVFLPPPMFCYGISGICCTIPRDGDYFVYNNPDSSRNNLSGDKYTFCKKCFDSVKSDYILVGDDPAQTLIELPKIEFHQAKNDHQEQELFIDCIVCSRRFHNICVLYHEHIWPEGYICKLCVQQYNVKRKENRYLAHKLTMTDLANVLEKRVNDFLRKECDPDTGRVTIRVLAANDRVCEVKPRLKKHYGSQIHDGYPYRTKAIFAFQEIDGIDVVLFGMHVQEYDGRCPAPNTRRVYISYLDSVYYFRPKEKRTGLYYEILIGYLEYVKQLGFIYAHIWACPPSEGDDYIFHCHPPEQRVPKPKRLQEWYKTMLDIAINQRVVVDYKDIMKDFTESALNKATDIPYFEGDFWTSTIEDLIKELDIEEEDRRKFEELEAVKVSDDGYFDDSMEIEEPTETSDKRKSGGGTTHKKKNFKKTTSQRRITRKNMTNGTDLISKIHAMMEKHKESFFVVRLRNPMSNPATLSDTDPLIQCDLMESRDAFLNFAREKHCEFSSLRRAKYSTMVSLIELHSSTADKISYTCNSCRQLCDIRYHCTVCEDYDLCSKCYTTIKHEHRMERSDDTNETKTNSDTTINIQQQRQLTMQRMLDAIRHAVQCRNANCIYKNCAVCKRLLQHTKECTKASRSQCQHCNKFLSPIWLHAKTCTDQNCLLPFCATFKNKIQRQRAATMQADRRRIKAMHRAKMGPGPSPINSQNSEPTTCGKYHHSMESASPSSTGKMMPSSGKPSSMSSLVRTNLSQQLPSQQQHSVYFNGGKGNPTGGNNNNNNNNSGYPMMMTTHPQQTSQQWISSQQQIRYASQGGKPMAYGQQRIPYGGDPYMMRQPTPQVSSYPYSSNIAPQGYSYSQPMDVNTLGTVRSGSPMLPQQPQQQLPNRYPINSSYSQPIPMSYPQQSSVPSISHRSLSQGTPPNYSVSSNSVVNNKSNLIDSIEIKTEDSFDDPSKLQTSQSQQQQQPMFHPLLQSCSRPQSTSYYPNMPPTNNTYYNSQRPITPSPDYNMSVGRGIRLTSVPTNAYGTLPVQQRIFVPPSTSDLTTGINNNNNNNNTIGLQSTPPPSSVIPH